MKFSLDKIRVERRSVNPGEPLVIDLSFPPSVNNLFANSPHGGRFPTKQYKAWQDENAWRIAIDKHRRVPGPVNLSLQYEEKSGRRDLDNLQKAVLDFLVKHNLIDGDHRTVVRRIAAEWSQSVKGVRITISPAEGMGA